MIMGEEWLKFHKMVEKWVIRRYTCFGKQEKRKVIIYVQINMS